MKLQKKELAAKNEVIITKKKPSFKICARYHMTAIRNDSKHLN